MNKLFLSLTLIILFSACEEDKTDNNSTSQEVKEVQNISSRTHAYVIFDNSGSTVRDNLEEINVNDLSELSFHIAKLGGGVLWLNYVDENAIDNEVSYFDIPKLGQRPTIPVAPDEDDYETRIHYSKAKKKYDKDVAIIQNQISEYSVDSTKIRDKISSLVPEYQTFLDAIYKKKPRWSDCFGAIQLGLKATETTTPNTNRYIIAFSDLKDDAKKNKVDSVPNDVTIIRVHHSIQIPEYDWISKENDISYKRDLLKKIK